MSVIEEAKKWEEDVKIYASNDSPCIVHVRALIKELEQYKAVVDAVNIDEWWRQNVKAARDGNMERITLSVNVDEYENLGKALSQLKEKG